MNDIQATHDVSHRMPPSGWEDRLATRLRQAYTEYLTSVPHDVAAALADPATPWMIRLHGFHVIDNLSELTGPACGILELSDDVLPDDKRRHYDLGNLRDVWTLYGKLLRLATPDQLRTHLNHRLLLRAWNPCIAHTVIRRVWERRFPELAAAA